MNESTTTLPSIATSTPATLQQRWEEQIQRWSKSGLSKSAFCKQTGINYHQMIYWSRKLSSSNTVPDNSSGNTSKGSGFVAVSVTPPSAGLFLRLPNGIEIGGIEEPRLTHIINLVSR